MGPRASLSFAACVYRQLQEKDRGPLDFDQPGGVDTTWQRVYVCLRAGFLPEAAQVSQPVKCHQVDRCLLATMVWSGLD